MNTVCQKWVRSGVQNRKSLYVKCGKPGDSRRLEDLTEVTEPAEKQQLWSFHPLSVFGSSIFMVSEFSITDEQRGRYGRL